MSIFEYLNPQDAIDALPTWREFYEAIGPQYSRLDIELALGFHPHNFLTKFRKQVAKERGCPVYCQTGDYETIVDGLYERYAEERAAYYDTLDTDYLKMCVANHSGGTVNLRAHADDCRAALKRRGEVTA